MAEQILFQKLSDKAIIPTRSEPDSAGLDLYAAEAGDILPNSRLLIKTNITWAAPKGFYGRIAPRSGLAYKFGIDVFGGVIDSSYRGDIGVILYNSTPMNVSFSAGDRIAQLIIEKYYEFPIVEVKELPDSARMGLGFGSSGK